MEATLDLGYLRQIFDLTEQTIAPRVNWVPDREHERQVYRDTLALFDRETDDGFYFHHVAIVFFSGFRASVVEAKLPAIHAAFPGIETVMEYDRDRIGALMADPRIIRNRAKITAVVANAREFRTIIDQHGSFRSYLRSFNEGFPEGVGDPARVLDDLDRLQSDLMRRLAFFGPATSRHFLMDYGLNFIKPDVHVMRFLHRLGLVNTDGEKSYRDAVLIGRAFADAVDAPVRYVDSVLVSMGMTSEANICRKAEPLCSECRLRALCAFAVIQGVQMTNMWASSSSTCDMPGITSCWLNDTAPR